ncbi:MAG: MBL fold metallo-hydrolase [Treponema sp.]|nr:MBL fold metallo-hydrolase [Treponema sp.]
MSRPYAVIDPGSDAELIIKRLKELNASPRIFLLTHGHFDHTGALSQLAAYYAGQEGGVEIAIHQDDAGYLGADSFQTHRRCWVQAAGNADYIDRFWRPMPAPTRFIAQNDHIGSLRVLHVPGHSPGSTAFYDENAHVIFTGDSLFKQAVGRTDLPGGDEALLRKSLIRLCALDPDAIVYPGHGETTTIRAERLFN